MRRRSLLLLTALLLLNACILPQVLFSSPVNLPTPASTALAEETTAPPTADTSTARPTAAAPTEVVKEPTAVGEEPTAVGEEPTVAATLPAAENPGADEVAVYDIAVTLDPQARSLVGSETLTYRNTAAEPFDEIVFHLYLNAFKSLDTVFMQESGGQLRGFPFDAENAGSIDVTAIRLQDGGLLELELLEDGTLARARLPQPVAPGQSVTVEIDFRAQLPQIFARTGWALDGQGDPFFLVAQWFPKPGVWQDDGWAADVFHGNAEFFADFGRYDVEIRLPAGYVTGATGLEAAAPSSSGAMQTVRYQAAGVIDFAWVASPNLKEARQQAGGVELRYLYLPEHAWSADPTLEIAAHTMQRFSDWFGAYPYPRLTIVDVPEDGSGAGGMEYPTFITVGAEGSPSGDLGGWANFLEIVTVHEIAHQWWQSMVATDEGREPWLDEGFSDYSTVLLMADRYGLPFSDTAGRDFSAGFLEGRRRAFLRAPDLPMLAASWEFQYEEYVIGAYAKPDLALMTLEAQLGRPVMLEVLSTYFERWGFGHPTTADFEQVAVEVSGQPLDWFFDGLVYGDDTLNWSVDAIQGSSVTVVREGDIALPAEVLVTLQGGAQQTEICPAEKTTCTLRFEAPVSAVEIDPDHKLIIDLDWADNRLTAAE